ncbi:MAG: DNA-binding protein WhiA [Firmicutes bacterium]|nr:DNA-binding protein WhiA [Bacillota bacterium]
MSFASDVKNELARTEPEKSCCQLAEISGFLRVAGTANFAGGGKFGVTASTGDPAIARHYKRLIKKYFEVDPDLKIEEIELFGKERRYLLTVGHQDVGEEILRETGLLLVRQGKNYFTDGIFDGLIKSKCCKKSYLRGMFLGAGTVTDPRKSYHLEIACGTETLAKDLQKLINSFVDLSCKISHRRGKYIIYMKNSSYIRDTLAIMGAHSYVLDLDNTLIEKEMKEEAVRLTNCDNANMDRTLDAAQEQIEVINSLKKRGTYESLSPKLKEIAELRLANPEASLTQLGEMAEPPIKKSGVNNRIKRIFELARN